MFALNYEGLKKRETYDEIIDYLMNKQEKIKMPNRLAKQLRNSPQLSNLLDGEGEGALEMEEQQRRAATEVERQRLIRENANLDGGVTERSAFQPRTRASAPTQFFDLSANDFEDDIDMAVALSKKQEEGKKFKMSEQLKEHLATRVREAMWEPRSAGVWYKPGEATSSSPPSHSTQLALPAPAKAGFTVGSTPPPSSYYRAFMKEPPKSLMNAVAITPMKPNIIQMTPPPPKPKFNSRPRLTPE